MILSELVDLSFHKYKSNYETNLLDHLSIHVSKSLGQSPHANPATTLYQTKMVSPEKPELAVEELETPDYIQEEKHEPEGESFNVWDGDPLPPIPDVSEYETR